MAALDRTTEDVGNIVHLEHVNVTQPDQRLATLFYVVALGGTRDPYLFVGLDNMWVNFGRSQYHMPSRAPMPQVLRGTTGLVVPDLAAAKKRLAQVAPELAGTKFAWRDAGTHVEAVCPWGNRFRLHAPAPEFGATDLGMPYVECDVPPGTAEGIARFYPEVMGAPARVVKRGGAPSADVAVGRSQHLYFTETAAPLPEYDGHHIQIYIADFSGPYKWLLERGLISMETNAHEWRFQTIVDPASEKPLFTLEHEVRSMRHPLFNRPLVNRNHSVTNVNYVPGQDGFRGTY
jgi:hypothetical protein